MAAKFVGTRPTDILIFRMVLAEEGVGGVYLVDRPGRPVLGLRSQAIGRSQGRVERPAELAGLERCAAIIGSSVFKSI